MARNSAFSNRRSRTMPVVRQRWKLDGLSRGWLVPTGAVQPVVTDGTATPPAIALSVTTPAPTALGGGPAFGNGTPCVVTRIATTQTTPAVSATNTVTPTSWTPQANALLVVVASGWFNDGGSGATTFSIGDTFSGTGAWSTAVTAGSTMDAAATYSNRQSIFVAQLGATPGNHSLTVTRTAGNINQWLWVDVYEVTGHDTSSPVGSTSTGDGFVSINPTWTVETGMIPSRTTSAVFSGFIGDGSGVDSHVIPRGFTQGGNTLSVTATSVMSSAYKVGLAGFPRWFWGANSNGSVSINAEIKAASPSTSGVLTGAQGKVTAATTLDVAVDGIGGSDVLMLVSVGTGVPAANDGVYTTTATFNSVSMTSLSKVHSNGQTAGYVQVFYLKNPSSGSHNIHVATSSTADIEVSAVVIGGTDGATPVALNSGTGSSATPSVALTGNTLDRLEIGCLAAGNEIEYFSDNTELSIQNQNLSSGAGNGAMTVATGTGSSFTMDAVLLASDIWAFVGVEVKANPNGTATPAAIALAATTPTPTTIGETAGVTLSVTVPAPTVTGTANTTPTAITRTVVVPAPTTTGAVKGGATPRAIGLGWYEAVNLSTAASSPRNGASGFGRTKVAQSFTADGSSLREAVAYLSCANLSAGTMVAEIFAHSGTFGTSSVGTGAALATSESVSVTSLSRIGAIPVAFDFIGANQITLVNGTNYVLAISWSGLVPNNNVDLISYSPPSVGIAGNISDFISPTWSATAANDMAFVIIGSDAAHASTAVPAPTTSGTANATPAAIALNVVVPAPTAGGGSNTTPAAIALTTVTSAPTASGGSNTTPTAIALTVTVPAPTATGGVGAVDGTATPTAITLTVVTSAPTATGDSNTTPTAIALTVVVPAPTASGSSNTSPAAIALVVVVPAPTASGTSNTTPTAIALTVVTSAPTASGDARAPPAAIALAATTPAPTATGGADGTAFPTAIALTVSLGTATASGNSTASPATISLSTTTTTPTGTGTASTTPSTIALSTVPSAPAASGDANTTPAAIALADTVPPPTVTGGTGATATPTAIDLSTTTTTPTATGQGVAFPSTITLTVVTPAPQATGAAAGQAAPATIVLTVVVPTPAASGGSTTSPTTIALTATLGTATATGGADGTAAPTAITVAATVPTPAATGEVSVNTTPAAIALAVVVPAPQATGSSTGQASPAAVMLSAVLGTAAATGGATATPPHIDVTVITTTPVATGSVVYFPYWGARVG